MATNMSKAMLLICSFTALGFLTSLIFCEGQLSWEIVTRIEIHPDGSATWVIRKKTTLNTESDRAAFLDYVNLTSIEDFLNNVKSIVNEASVITGRAMKAENLDMVASVFNTTTGFEGILQYQYDWIGFAKEIEGEKIKVGDALNGQLDLSRNDMLIIQYPTSYTIENVDPTQDDSSESDRTITWYGPRNFGAGEPTVILRKNTLGVADFILSNAFVTSLIILILSCLGGLGLVKLKSLKKQKDVKVSEVTPLRIELESDEEKVINLLKESGGRLYQKAIAKHYGFSKSKTSELLTAMEQKEIVARKKRGRQKLVILIDTGQTD